MSAVSHDQPAQFAIDAAPGVERRSAPHAVEWLIAIFAAIVQQGAFVSIPLYFGKNTLLIREDVNGLNTLAVGASFATMLLVCLPQARRIASLAWRNAPAMLFLALVLASVLWSIHRDISLRRGIGYVLTVLVALYLVARFDSTARMKVLSAAFTIAALGSFVFVALFPHDGIMQIGELSGNWRGVYPHKNVLGPIMAAAVFVEVYILAASGPRSRWRYLLLALYLALVLLSHSATALLLSALYIAGAMLWVLGRRTPVLGALASTFAATGAALAAAIVCIQPEALLGVLGKDTTLTGRTAVWQVVSGEIAEHPLVGLGYRAAWVLGDSATMRANEATGGWGVGNSHNAYLEITLQLGLLGAAALAAIIVTALWRGLRCRLEIPGPLGAFSLIYFTGALISGFVMETFGQNQVIEWVLFNVMMFGCGQALDAKSAASAASALVTDWRPARALRRA